MDGKKKLWDFYYCYIKSSGFREYFNICLYKSGDIDIKMRESCHADYLECIYEYKEDRAQQDAFLEKFKDGFAVQIMNVANCKLIDYHSFMHMLHGEWHFKDAYKHRNKDVCSSYRTGLTAVEPALFFNYYRLFIVWILSGRILNVGRKTKN